MPPHANLLPINLLHAHPPQARTSAWVVGSATSFATPTVWCGKHLVAVLRPHGASQASLACCDANNARLEDSQHRMPLTTDAVALCSMHDNAAAAVVCLDGTIVAAIVDDNTCPRWVQATCGNNLTVEAAQYHAGTLHILCRAADTPQQRHLHSFTFTVVRGVLFCECFLLCRC